MFRDDADRARFLIALDAACARESVALHAYALLTDRVWLLCTPTVDQALGRSMQALGRRYSASFNRRHQRTGGLWDGRYRSTVVEPGATLLAAMVFVDRLLPELVQIDGLDQAPPPWSSSRQHLGYGGPPQLNDIAEYWALGNTPFDRAAAYRRLLIEPASDLQRERIESAAQRGWALGSAAFVGELQAKTRRPLVPRRRGRPRLR